MENSNKMSYEDEIKMKKMRLHLIVVAAAVFAMVILGGGMAVYAYDYPDSVNHDAAWSDCSGAQIHFYSTGETYCISEYWQNFCVKGKIYNGPSGDVVCEDESNQNPVSSFVHGYKEGWYYFDNNEYHPCNPAYADNYVLTLTDGKVAGERCATVTAGDTVTITADESQDNDMTFDKWKVASGSVDISAIMSSDDVTDSTAYITMPAESITVKATYKEKPLTFTSNPADGSKVSEIKEIIVKFNRNIYQLYETSREAFVKTPNGDDVCTASVDYADESRADSIKVVLDDKITDPGEYKVIIPKDLLRNSEPSPYLEDDLVISLTIPSADDSDDDEDDGDDEAESDDNKDDKDNKDGDDDKDDNIDKKKDSDSSGKKDSSNDHNNNGNDDNSGKEYTYYDRVVDDINKAIALGGKQTVYLNEGTALPYSIMKLLKDNPDITLVFTYTYKNVNYKITLSGKNVTEYENIPWYGPLYLFIYYGTPDSIIR